MRFIPSRQSHRSLLIATGIVFALGVAAAVLLLAFGRSEKHGIAAGAQPAPTPGPAKTVIADRGIDPKAASWTKPWHPGNPQAKTFGEAYQVLDPQHPLANAGAVFWLGGIQGSLYPYARAMQGDNKEVIQSSVAYGDKRSADLVHLLITVWDTRPFPFIHQQTQGGKLLAEFQGMSHHTAANGLVWADADTPGPGWQALVVVGPHTIVQVIRMDETVPQLAALVAKLQSFKAAAPAPVAPAPAATRKRAVKHTTKRQEKPTRRARVRHAR